jgi:hypothetical protein
MGTWLIRWFLRHDVCLCTIGLRGLCRRLERRHWR